MARTISWRRLAAGLMLLTTGIVVIPSSSHPMNVPAQQPRGRIYYTVDASFLNAGYQRPSLWSAEQAWKIQNLWQYAEFWNDEGQPGAGNRRVMAQYIDGPGNRDAEATVGCAGNGSTCVMRFEPAVVRPGAPTSGWNTTMEIRDDSWLDFVGVATHEFGHWVGLHHSSDRPFTDASAVPTMQDPRDPWNGRHFRTIQADDVNAFRGARAVNIAANSSFDWDQPDWGGAFRTGWNYRAGPMVDRNCWAAPHDGSCFMAYAGNGSSIYQDVLIANGNWFAGRTLWPWAWLRAPFAGQNSSATINVWRMEGPGAPNVIYSRSCTLPGGGGWIHTGSGWCSGQTSFFEPGDSVPIRIEIYNTSNTNLDVDGVELGL